MSFRAWTFPVGAFQCNCTILLNVEQKAALVIDPGDEAEAILDIVEGEKLNVLGLWHSHAHIDHIGATQELLKKLSERQEQAPKVYLHPEDKWLYENVKLQAQLLNLSPFEVPKNFDSLKSNSSQLAATKTHHTPGHTPGSCCLEIEGPVELEMATEFCAGLSKSAPRALVSGDTLFRRSIGRTDLWGGDFELIEKSIQKKLYALAPESYVIPGHGPLTRIVEEIEKNPFVRP